MSNESSKQPMQDEQKIPAEAAQNRRKKMLVTSSAIVLGLLLLLFNCGPTSCFKNDKITNTTEPKPSSNETTATEIQQLKSALESIRADRDNLAKKLAEQIVNKKVKEERSREKAKHTEEVTNTTSNNATLNTIPQEYEEEGPVFQEDAVPQSQSQNQEVEVPEQQENKNGDPCINLKGNPAKYYRCRIWNLLPPTPEN